MGCGASKKGVAVAQEKQDEDLIEESIQKLIEQTYAEIAGLPSEIDVDAESQSSAESDYSLSTTIVSLSTPRLGSRAVSLPNRSEKAKREHTRPPDNASQVSIYTSPDSGRLDDEDSEDAASDDEQESRPQTDGYETDTESYYDSAEYESTEYDSRPQTCRHKKYISRRRPKSLDTELDYKAAEALRRREYTSRRIFVSSDTEYVHRVVCLRHREYASRRRPESFVSDNEYEYRPESVVYHQQGRVPNNTRQRRHEEARRRSFSEEANYGSFGIDEEKGHGRPGRRYKEDSVTPPYTIEQRRAYRAGDEKEQPEEEYSRDQVGAYSSDDGLLDGVLRSDRQLSSASARLVSLTLQNVFCDLEDEDLDETPELGSVSQGPTRELDKETLLSSMSSMLVCRAIGNAMSEMSVDNRQPTETTEAELRRSRSSDSIILVNTNETDFCHVFDLSTRLVSRAIQNAIERYENSKEAQDELKAQQEKTVSEEDTELFVKGAAIPIQEITQPEIQKKTQAPNKKNITSKSFGGLPSKQSKPVASIRQSHSYKTVKTTNTASKVKNVSAPKPVTNKRVPPKGPKTLQSNSGGRIPTVKAPNTVTKQKPLYRTSNKYKNVPASSSVVAYKKDLAKGRKNLQSKSFGGICNKNEVLKGPKMVQSNSVGAINKYKNVKASTSVVAYKKDLAKGKKNLQSKSFGGICNKNEVLKGPKMAQSNSVGAINKYKNVKASTSVVAYKKDLAKGKNNVQSKSFGGICNKNEVLKGPKMAQSNSVGAITPKPSIAAEIKNNKSTGDANLKTAKTTSTSRPSKLITTNRAHPASKSVPKTSKNQARGAAKLSKATGQNAGLGASTASKSVVSKNTGVVKMESYDTDVPISDVSPKDTVENEVKTDSTNISVSSMGSTERVVLEADISATELRPSTMLPSVGPYNTESLTNADTSDGNTPMTKLSEAFPTDDTNNPDTTSRASTNDMVVASIASFVELDNNNDVYSAYSPCPCNNCINGPMSLSKIITNHQELNELSDNASKCCGSSSSLSNGRTSTTHTPNAALECDTGTSNEKPNAPLEYDTNDTPNAALEYDTASSDETPNAALEYDTASSDETPNAALEYDTNEKPNAALEYDTTTSKVVPGRFLTNGKPSRSMSVEPSNGYHKSNPTKLETTRSCSAACEVPNSDVLLDLKLTKSTHDRAPAAKNTQRSSSCTRSHKRSNTDKVTKLSSHSIEREMPSRCSLQDVSEPVPSFGHSSVVGMTGSSSFSRSSNCISSASVNKDQTLHIKSVSEDQETSPSSRNDMSSKGRSLVGRTPLSTSGKHNSGKSNLPKSTCSNTSVDPDTRNYSLKDIPPSGRSSLPNVTERTTSATSGHLKPAKSKLPKSCSNHLVSKDSLTNHSSVKDLPSSGRSSVPNVPGRTPSSTSNQCKLGRCKLLKSICSNQSVSDDPVTSPSTLRNLSRSSSSAVQKVAGRTPSSHSQYKTGARKLFRGQSRSGESPRPSSVRKLPALSPSVSSSSKIGSEVAGRMPSRTSSLASPIYNKDTMPSSPSIDIDTLSSNWTNNLPSSSSSAGSTAVVRSSSCVGGVINNPASQPSNHHKKKSFSNTTSPVKGWNMEESSANNPSPVLQRSSRLSMSRQASQTSSPIKSRSSTATQSLPPLSPVVHRSPEISCSGVSTTSKSNTAAKTLIPLTTEKTLSPVPMYLPSPPTTPPSGWSSRSSSRLSSPQPGPSGIKQYYSSSPARRIKSSSEHF